MNSCSDLHQHRTCHSSWSDLPLELLTLILTRLESEEDIRHFRIVCKSWNTSRLSSNIIPSVPLLSISFSNPTTRKLVTSLLFPPDTPLSYPNSMEKPLCIVSYNVYVLRRNVDGERWLVGIAQSKPGKFHLVHPLTRIPLKKLLPMEFPKLLSDFWPLRISTGYDLRLSNEHVVKNGKLAKVIYWKNPYESSSDDVQDVSLMVLYYSGMLKCLSLMGNNNSKLFCKEIIYRETKLFDDIMKWNDKIVAVDEYGRLHEIEYKTMSVTTMLAASSNITDSTIGRKRLLEWNGQLYLVVQRKYSHMMSPVVIGVYVLNIGSGLWEKLRSLGDRILFMSSDNCFFVDSNGLLPGQGFGNCVVFSQGCFSSTRYDYPYIRDEYLFTDNPGYFQSVGVHDYNKSPNFRLLSSNSTLSTAFWPPRWVFKSGEESCKYRGKVTDPDETKEELEAREAKKRKGKETITESTFQNLKKCRTSKNKD